MFRLVSFIRRLAGRARIFKRGRAKRILRERTSLGGSGRAGAAVARRSVIRRSCAIEAIEIHHLFPSGDELAHELVLRVVARVDLRERAELRVRSEDEIDAAGGPSDVALRTAASLERVSGSDVGFHCVPSARAEQVARRPVVTPARGYP
jgi:hypothetical protein